MHDQHFITSTRGKLYFSWHFLWNVSVRERGRYLVDGYLDLERGRGDGLAVLVAHEHGQREARGGPRRAGGRPQLAARGLDARAGRQPARQPAARRALRARHEVRQELPLRRHAPAQLMPILYTYLFRFNGDRPQKDLHISSEIILVYDHHNNCLISYMPKLDIDALMIYE